VDSISHETSHLALWTAELGERPAGPPVVVGDLLLVPTQGPGATAQRSTLHALALADGSPRWQQSFDYALVSGLAAALPGYILVTTASTDLLRGQGALLALDAAGEERWRWVPGVQRVSAPTVGEDVVCITADARTFLVLDLATGGERTRGTLEAIASLAAPALVNQRSIAPCGRSPDRENGQAQPPVGEALHYEPDWAYVPCRGPHLLAVGLDGATRWHYTADDGPNAWLDQTPVVVGDRLFAVLTTGAVLALRARDGARMWRVNVGPAGKPLSPPATDGQRLFVGARDGLHALDLTDGCEVWYFPTGRRVEAQPLVVGAAVYATGHDHRLYALDAATGRERWQYEAARRLEVSPVVATCGEASRPCIVVADRAGALTAVARPLSAAEHEAAGHWVEAACAYAAQGDPARGARLLEAHGEPFKSAELWKAAGDLERGATQYQAAGAWQPAAELWSVLGRPLKRAKALEQHARSLEDEPVSDEERATAWAIAAETFEAEGEVERATTCQREVARYHRQPIIGLDVQHKELVLNAWSTLLFIVRNEGYGPACNLVIHARGDQFEGQVTSTRQIATLRAGREHTDWLDVRPRAHGDSVPLRVRLEYLDASGNARTSQQTVYLTVARTLADRDSGQIIAVSGVALETESLRRRLMADFDDAGLDAFSLDHFPEVYDRFTRGMRKDEKITLVLDYCRRDPARWEKLVTAVEEHAN